jgi:hypothetical protein
MACRPHPLRHTVWPILVVLGLVPVPGHGIDPHSNTDAALAHAVKAFDDAAIRINDVETEGIARWAGTIYLAIAEYSGMTRATPGIEAAIGELATLARLSVVRVPWNDRRANFTFRPGTSEPAGAGMPPCRSAISWQDGVVQRAEIVVNLANHGRVKRCVNHEAMHGFGFRSHAHSALSVLSYRRADQETLSWVDRLMLTTLYDSRLRPGMRGAAALPIACGVMAEKLQVRLSDRTRICANRVPDPRSAIFGGRIAN